MSNKGNIFFKTRLRLSVGRASSMMLKVSGSIPGIAKYIFNNFELNQPKLFSYDRLQNNCIFNSILASFYGKNVERHQFF